MTIGECWSVIVGPVSAIIASALTAYLAYRFELRRRRTEENLRWLEERYQPALRLLGELVGILSAARGEERDEWLSIQNQIRARASQAWPCAFQLDPEDTGLRDLVLEVLAYGHIARSKEDFYNYAIKVLSIFQTLNRIFLEERERILSGKSLMTLIRERMQRKQQETERFHRGIKALQAYTAGRKPLKQTLPELERSGIRGGLLRLLLNMEREKADTEGKARLSELENIFHEQGWL